MGTKAGDIGRNKEERRVITERRERVAALYLEGVPQYRIAKTIGVCDAVVSKDLRVLEEQWKRHAIESIDKHKANELAKINRMEREAWTAWRKSKKAREISTARTKKTRRGGESEAMLRKEQTAGETEYMKIVQWCINKRCELLGLDAPKKIAPTTPDGKEPLPANVTIISYGEPPPDDLPEPIRERISGRSILESTNGTNGSAAH